MRPQHTHAARNQAFFGCLNPHQEINLEHGTAVYFLRRSNKWARPTNKKAWTEGKWLKGCVWQRATKEIGHFGVQNSHFENEAKCETFVVKMSFICMRVKIIFLSLAHLHLNLALKQRLEATRNRPICKRQSSSSSSSSSSSPLLLSVIIIIIIPIRSWFSTFHFRKSNLLRIPNAYNYLTSIEQIE